MRIERLGLSLTKGTRHETLSEIVLDAEGPRGDRELCLVDPEARKVLRTVRHPELIRVRMSRVPGGLRMELADQTLLDRPVPTGHTMACDYWGRRPVLELLDTAFTDPLTELLGRPVRLARSTNRGDVVYAAPLTIVTVSDLRELGHRADVPELAAESARFRATVLVDDADQPIDPDAAGRLRLGDAVVELAGPIPRCAVIDSDPATGSKDRALLAALAGYRRRAGEIWFGHYARVVTPGRCRTGDDVQWRA